MTTNDAAARGVPWRPEAKPGRAHEARRMEPARAQSEAPTPTRGEPEARYSWVAHGLERLEGKEVREAFYARLPPA